MMLQGPVIILTSFAYLGLLFAIAFYADKRADAGRPVTANAYVYSLSLAVYATAWTFYGSVGRAASDGVGILPYISLQLKAISSSYSILVQYPAIAMPAAASGVSVFSDTAFWVALILAAFT